MFECRMSAARLPRMAGVVAGSAMLVAMHQAAFAATITPTIIGDVVADDGECSLREAVVAINTGSPSGTAPGECPAGDGIDDTIQLTAGHYSLSPTVGDDLDLTGDLTILGAGACDLSPGSPSCPSQIDGGGVGALDDRIFDIADGVTASMRQFLIIGGNVSGSGGGIRTGTNATLNLDGMIVANNVASGSGGGISVDSGASLTVTNSLIAVNLANDGGGVAVLNSGVANVNGAVFSQNIARNDGGGLWKGSTSVVTVAASAAGLSQFLGNQSCRGGGIFATGSGPLSLNDTLLRSNLTVTNAADGICPSPDGSSYGGGGLYAESSASITIENTDFEQNQSRRSGGAIQLRNIATSSITGGSLTGNVAGLGDTGSGGALQILASTLTVTGTQIGGAAGLGNMADTGGGIFWSSLGNLQLDDVDLRGNLAAGRGGGIHAIGRGNLRVNGGSLRDNVADGDSGGGLYAEGGQSVHLRGVTVSGNRSTDDGGGLALDGTVASDPSLFISSLNGVPTRIVGNIANSDNSGDGSGGGIFARLLAALTISDTVIGAVGQGNSTISNAGGGLRLSDLGTPLVMNNVTIAHNRAENGGAGGGLYVSGATSSVEATGLTVANNYAEFHSGGFAFFSGSTGDLRRTTIRDNVSDGFSGAMYLLSAAALTLRDSLVAGNVTRTLVSNAWGTIGVEAGTRLTAINTTFSGNRVETDDMLGSAIDSGGAVDLINSTVTANITTHDTSSAAVLTGRTNSVLNVINSVISGNFYQDPAGNLAPADCFDFGSMGRALASNGYNFLGAGCDALDMNPMPKSSAGAKDLRGIDPVLGPLADNGGPTFTHLPLPGSPLIDGGDPNGCVDNMGALHFTDQRGAPRPVDGDGDGDFVCDIGAVERGPQGQPVAADDVFTVVEDAASTLLSVLANDTDPQNDALRVTQVDAGSAGGTVTIATGGTGLSYRPATNFNGTETFGYTVSDNTGNFDRAQVTVTVTPANDSVNAADDAFTVNEDSQNNILAVLGNDIDPDGDGLTIFSVTLPNNGGSVTPADGGTTLSYTPDVNFSGIETFSYMVSDGTTTSNAQVTVTVTEDNDPNEVDPTPVAPMPPVAVNDSFTVNEDSVSNTLSVLANDSDANGDALSIVAVGAGSAGGTITANAASVSYSPAANFAGTETFSYTITDGSQTASATVIVTVTQDNDPDELPTAPLPPVARNDAFTVNEDSTGNTLSVLANDNDANGDALSIVAVGAGSAGGTITANAASVSYSPATNFAGTETFSYTISDGAQTATATVTVTVTDDGDVNETPSDNRAPVLVQIGFVVNEDSQDNVLAILRGASDLDGDRLVITGVGLPGNGGRVAIRGDGNSLVYTPAPDFAGNETFTVTIFDGEFSVTGPVVVAVTQDNDPTDGVPLNNPPVLRDAALQFSLADGEGRELQVLLGDLDPEGDPLSIIAVSQPVNGGQVQISVNGRSLIFTPADGFAGEEFFTYTVSDGRGGVATAGITVRVTRRGSASGSAGAAGLWLGFLGLVALLRRRVHLLAAAGMAVALPVSAGDYYLGLSAGAADSSVSAETIEGRLANRGFDTRVDNVDHEEFLVQAFVGWQFHPMLSAEFGYLRLGDFDVEYRQQNGDAGQLAGALAEIHPAGGHGLQLMLASALPLSDRLSFQGKLGVYHLLGSDVDIRINGQSRELDPNDEFAPTVAVGLLLRNPSGPELALNWQAWEINDQRLTAPSLSLRWRFGFSDASTDDKYELPPPSAEQSFLRPDAEATSAPPPTGQSAVSEESAASSAQNSNTEPSPQPPVAREPVLIFQTASPDSADSEVPLPEVRIGVPLPEEAKLLSNDPIMRVSQSSAVPAERPCRQSVLENELKLQALGYDAGVIDGHFDTTLSAAVRAFQARHGLITDGALQSETRDLLAHQIELLQVQLEPARCPT